MFSPYEEIEVVSGCFHRLETENRVMCRLLYSYRALDTITQHSVSSNEMR